MVTTLLSSWEIMPQLVIVWNGYLKIDTVLAIAVLLCLVCRSRTDGPVIRKKLALYALFQNIEERLPRIFIKNSSHCFAAYAF